MKHKKEHFMAVVDPPKKHFVVLTGAGISASAGIQTYRDSNGLWDNHDPAKVATAEALRKDIDAVNAFFDQLWEKSKDAQPTEANKALARLGTKYEVTVLTQNIDDLHEKSGSRVVHAHGKLSTIYDYDADSYVDRSNSIAKPFNYRPDVVLFGEDVLNIDFMIDRALLADELWIIGSDMSVHPFAGIPGVVRAQAKKLKKPFIVRHFNTKETEFWSRFKRTWTPREQAHEHHGFADMTVVEHVDKLMK